MQKDIEPKLKKISDYLRINKDEFFLIPEYQRMYSWDTNQCDKLMTDIEDFMENPKPQKEPYFFGTIIVDCSQNNYLKLIDGQQRTITFLLLLKALLLIVTSRLEKLSEMRDDDSQGLIYALKYALNDRRNKIIDILYRTNSNSRLNIFENNQKEIKKIDSEKVKEINPLLKSNSINELYKDELINILVFKDFNEIEKNVKKIPKKQRDNKYTTYFKNFKYFFEKINNMGDHELNKFTETFIEECQIIEIRSWQFAQAIVMFNSLNSTGLPLSDSDIISAMLYSKLKDGNDKKIFNEKWEGIRERVEKLSSQRIIDIDSVLQEFMYISRSLKKEYLKNNSIDVNTPGVRNYYTEKSKELLDNPLDLCEKFIKIISIWEKVIDFPMCKLLLKYNENIKIFFISYLFKYDISEITENIVNKISILLIKLFTLLELGDIAYSSKNFKIFLFGENIKFVDEKINFLSIEDDFNNHISNNWKKQDIKELILDYDKNILVFLNEFLFAQENSLNFDFNTSVNIEHIMPSSGRYIDSIRLDAKIYDKEEFNSIVNSLGNKILLEEDINKSIGIEWFKTKKQKTVSEKKGYRNSKYNIAKSLVDYKNDVWTKDDIKKMNEKIADRIINFIFN